MRLKKILPLIPLVLALLLGIQASVAQGRQERTQWLSEVSQYRNNFFARELGLSKEQQKKFFPLYEEMDEKIRQSETEVRTMERRLLEATDVTNTEYEKAAEVFYDSKIQQATTEKEYMQKFSEILTPRQLFMLNSVEKKFTQQMLKQHHRLKGAKKQADK